MISAVDVNVTDFIIREIAFLGKACLKPKENCDLKGQKIVNYPIVKEIDFCVMEEFILINGPTPTAAKF